MKKLSESLKIGFIVVTIFFVLSIGLGFYMGEKASNKYIEILKHREIYDQKIK